MNKEKIKLLTPTIINKFNKLSPHLSYDNFRGNTVEFFGEDGKPYLYYEARYNELYFSPKYFMLLYFGFTGYEHSLNNSLLPLFTKLINDKLGYTLVSGNNRFPKTTFHANITH
jgi:hypothetical protein